MNSVEVQYTPGDLYVVTFLSGRRTILRILTLFGILIAIFIAIPVLTDGMTVWVSMRWFPWDLYLGLIVFLLLFIFGVCPLISYFRSKRLGFLGPHQIRFLNEGVQIDGPKGESLIYWSAVRRLRVTKNRLLLFIAPSSAILLPRRTFKDQIDFEAAVSNARSRCSKAMN